MKSVGKLALLAITLLINTNQQVEAHRIHSSIRIRTFDEGDETAQTQDKQVPSELSALVPAQAQSKTTVAEERKAPSAFVEERKTNEEPVLKEASKLKFDQVKDAKDLKPTAAIDSEETRKVDTKDGKKQGNIEEEDEGEDDEPPTLLDPGASAGQSHTVDALQTGPCEERLNITEYEMIKQMEYFSRRLEIDYFNNAMNIWLNLTKEGRWDKPLMVHTWELYDKAFEFPRVRRYAFVQDNLDMLEHFEDNLNTNVSNRQNLANFLRVANTVRHNLNNKYGEKEGGGFNDPALVDPYKIKIDTWSTVKLPDPVF